jgi:hypothetical protein
MQEIFLCPTCGAQNLVGQEFCQACGQRFQYNCPYCGAIVDSTLINCPKCRERLYWPTPQKVRPFPKQPVTHGEQEELGEKGAKPKKKSDPWLTGCLGLIIIAILVLGAYFIYDTLFKQEPSPTPPLTPPVSGNQTSLKPMLTPEPELLQIVSAIMLPEE